MKPYGRKVKKKVGTILEESTRSEALSRLKKIPDAQLTSHLFSYFYHMNELIKFRSTTAMGDLVLRISATSMEKARVILRRIMWNLNDESGGIGWGSPEAMGDILGKSPELAKEFKSILFSYLDTGGNYIEHEILQRGVLWGIGTYLEAAPGDLTQITLDQLHHYLDSPDLLKQGYAVRALINADKFDCRIIQEIQTDNTPIEIYTGWNFVNTRISDICHACTPEKTKA